MTPSRQLDAEDDHEDQLDNPRRNVSTDLRQRHQPPHHLTSDVAVSNDLSLHSLLLNEGGGGQQ